MNEVRSLRHENKIFPVYKMVDTCAAEFESHTPYFYSSYDEENESIKSDKPLVLSHPGSGPIRIGRTEFDRRFASRPFKGLVMKQLS